MVKVTSYLGIGSNLGDRAKNIQGSIKYLNSIPRIEVKEKSLLYETPACGGPKTQPKYLNATIKIRTSLSPFDLLRELKRIEFKLKRKKFALWGPRTIDLDILFYDDLILASDEFSIPHSLLHRRIFVLKPLADIAPNVMHPLYKKTIRDLLKKLYSKDEKIISFNKR
ncbi:MAG: 2-amino-4-hydroxy-6-hydroxymethyldihydropteridine diphosphokinase [Candidatus Omnitrophota bacterium]